MLKPIKVGPLIRELQQELGLTPQGLATKLGVSLQAITRWEKTGAKAYPSSFTQSRIEQALHELGTRGEELRTQYFSDEA